MDGRMLNTIKQIQELLEDTNAHLELDTGGLWFVRYFENGKYTYKKSIDRDVDLTMFEIVEHYLYESQYEFDKLRSSNFIF